jgi:hypothetical protein
MHLPAPPSGPHQGSEPDDRSITELARAIVRGDERPPAPPPPPAPVRVVAVGSVKSLRATSAVVQLLLASTVVVSSVAIGLCIVQRSLLNRVISNPLAVRVSEITADQHRINTMNAVWGVVFATTGVAFVVWFAVAYHNLDGLGARQRWGMGWAIGGWFVPFANFVMPKRLANDLWAGSRRSSASRADRPPESSALLNCWWAAWIAGAVVVFFIRSNGTNTPQHALGTNTAYIVRDSLLIVAAVLAILVVRAISRGQADMVRAARTTAPPNMGEPATR